MFLKETTPHEISIIIKELNVSKSSDIYGISSKFIKLASTPISTLLSIIFNKSIHDGIFPDSLKTAKVIPIHKNDSIFEVSNYRPISLLPIFSKIFERLMYTRLSEFITKHKILHDNQFGFQKNKSTELAVNSIISNIGTSFENKEIAHCIFLDFAKAFDTVNHDILINKLNHYGLRGSSLNWFKSYLTDRQQYTEIGNSLSDMCYIKCGVPQGSVLGPLLFLLYINDIVESSDILKFYLFADDTTIFYTSKPNTNTENILNTEINKVTEWLAANKLSLNISKSNMVTFSLLQNKIPMNIKIDNIPLTKKQCVKYLGVFIDEKLNWKNHIQHVDLKLSKGIGLLSKIRHYVPNSVLKSLFYSFINPYINYSLLNWSCTATTNLNCIRVKVKKAIRIISFKSKQEHTTPLFKKLNILPLDSSIKLKQATFMWKLNHGLIPDNIHSKFITNTSEIEQEA